MVQESRALGRSYGWVKVYKLQTICQLAADRQERANQDHETDFVRYSRPVSLNMLAGTYGSAAIILSLQPLTAHSCALMLTGQSSTVPALMSGKHVAVWTGTVAVCVHPCLALAGLRRSRRQVSQAKAFEAASQAQLLDKTWKKLCLTAGQLCLPVELWGLVLQQLLTQHSLWDLQATVQQMCHASLFCKDLCLAVQQQGCPHLCRLLSFWEAPIALQKANRLAAEGTGMPDILVTDPASLQVPQLRAACKVFGSTQSGMQAWH